MATSTTAHSPSTTPKSTSTRTSGAKKARSPRRKAQSANGNSRRATRRSNDGMTSQIYRQGRDIMASAYDTAASAGRYMPSLGGSLGLRGRKGQSMLSMIEERPLILGAVGLGVGIVLASLMPGRAGQRSHSR